MDYYNNAVDILTNPKHSRWVADCLLLAETVLCALVVWKVPCKQTNMNASPTLAARRVNLPSCIP
jgi:hypothetical protein